MLWLPGMSGTGQVLEASGSRLYGAAGSAFDAAVLATPGLINFYKMNEIAGAATCIDYGPGAQNGTNVGFTSGSTSLTTDGETSYLGTTTSRSTGVGLWVYTTTYTYGCIFKTPASIGTNSYYVLMANGNEATKGHALTYRDSNASPQFEIEWFNTAGANTNFGVSVAANTLYFIAVTVSGTTQKLYLNGTLQATKTNTNDTLDTGVFHLGNRPTLTFGFNNLFSKCFVCNQAIAQSDITTLQNAR